jgi:hypothetical protein
LEGESRETPSRHRRHDLFALLDLRRQDTIHLILLAHRDAVFDKLDILREYIHDNGDRPIRPRGVSMTVATLPVDPALTERFSTLAAEWKRDTVLLSSTSAITSHPAYQAIIDLGPAVVSLLLRDLEREPAHWFEALQAITGEDPVPEPKRGRILAMTEAWLLRGGKYVTAQ